MAEIQLFKRVMDSRFRGSDRCFQAFEGKWGAVPDAVRESLPYRHDQIDFAYLEREASNETE